MDSENTIVVKVHKVANLLHRLMTEVKADIDRKTGDAKNISVIQGRIVLYLVTETEKGIVFQKDIETYFDIRSSTAAIILRRMEKNGLVTREVSQEDARKKAVHLTQKAKRLHSLAQADIDNAERRVTKGLTRKELDDFVRILDKITKNIS